MGQHQSSLLIGGYQLPLSIALIIRLDRSLTNESYKNLLLQMQSSGEGVEERWLSLSLSLPMTKHLECSVPDAMPVSDSSASSMGESCWEDSGSVPQEVSASSETAIAKKHVCFGDCEIRKYPVILGDHPDCLMGPPVSILQSRMPWYDCYLPSHSLSHTHTLHFLFPFSSPSTGIPF